MLTSPIVLTTILVSVALSALGQVCLKAGMIEPGVQAALAGSSVLQVARTVATSVPVVGGLTLYGLGALFWLFVLAKVELSQAYPFVGLSFVVTTALGALLFHEAMTVGRAAGALLVVAGVVLVSRS
jgi:multidrug transporter EmrE-like cation transporter